MVAGVGAIPVEHKLPPELDGTEPGVIVTVQLWPAAIVPVQVVLVIEVPLGSPDELTDKPVAAFVGAFVIVNVLALPVRATFCTPVQSLEGWQFTDKAKSVGAVKLV